MKKMHIYSESLASFSFQNIVIAPKSPSYLELTCDSQYCFLATSFALIGFQSSECLHLLIQDNERFDASVPWE